MTVSFWLGLPAETTRGLLRTLFGSLVPGVIACAFVAVPLTWWAMSADAG